jgi:hypothetical protein
MARHIPFKQLAGFSVTWTINLPLRQLNGSKDARQLIDSIFAKSTKESRTTAC